MSRVEHESQDGKFAFVYGVDHVTSVFFQVYDEDEEVIVEANNTGVIKCEDFDSKFAFAKPAIDELEKAFESARISGNNFPNIDLDRLLLIAKKFGVQLERREMYQALD